MMGNEPTAPAPPVHEHEPTTSRRSAGRLSDRNRRHQPADSALIANRPPTSAAPAILQSTMVGTKKVLPLGHRIRYPITITKILKSAGDRIKKQEPVLQYSFKWMKEVGDPFKETWQEEQTTFVDWDSPADGKISSWEVREGQVITGDQPCMTVEEECSHEIQFQGLCAICGKDMTETNWASETKDTERAPINMTHDQTSLTVSALAATRAENELQRRLLAQRKLSLVVDLDQTIIHACIEPTIGEWQRDPTNPNYEAVKDVRSFQLSDEGVPRGIANGCWYYIKLRPGLLEFLNRISSMYELHVYTMGTRAYALNIAKLVDPDQKLFANRVISRDENGSMTAKSLQRLFPVSTNMVVIIDDRADVWPRNRPNLIKVTPYDFFKGIGDINSSFLPKREDLLVQTPAPTAETQTPAEGALADTQPGATTAGGPKVSAIEELVSMSSGDDALLRKKQAEAQERALEQQLKERPLLHMQEELDKEEKEAATTENTTQPDGAADGAADGATQEAPQAQPMAQHVRHHQLLFDDDTELRYLEEHLTGLHKAYYEEFDARKPAFTVPQPQPNGKNAHEAGSEHHAAHGRRSSSVVSHTSHKGSQEPVIDPSNVPDVGRVLGRLKSQVLQGTTIVLSGLVPLGVDVLRSEIGLQAQSFGANLQTRVNKRVTHLVISSNRPRTQKVRQAAKIPSIKIVNQDWLAECLRRWEKVDETPYLVEVHPDDRAGASAGQTQDTTDAETVSDVDTDDLETNKRLKISRPGRVVQDADEEDEEDSEDEGGSDMEFDMDGPMSPIDELRSFDWGGAEEEMKEFLASGDDDEDEDREDQYGDYGYLDSEADMDSTLKEGDDTADETELSSSRYQVHVGRSIPSATLKRKHDDETDSEGGDDSIPESSLAKKQRLARSRGASGLRQMVVTPADAAVERGSLPTPQVTGDEEEVLLLKDRTNTARAGASASADAAAAGTAVSSTGKQGDHGDSDDEDDGLEADLMAELEAEEQLEEKG